MTYVDWEIKARTFGNCNCSCGCPCQFNALPTHGNREAAIAVFVLLEKVVPHGVLAGRLSGALLLLAGLFVVVQGYTKER